MGKRPKDKNSAKIKINWYKNNALKLSGIIISDAFICAKLIAGKAYPFDGNLEANRLLMSISHRVIFLGY